DAARAAAAGAAGVIIPDVTLEVVEDVRGPLHQQGLALPLLISPTTRSERAARIAAASDGFIYIVSRMGVTGAGQGPDLEWCKAQVELLRRVTDKPLAVGFGISTPEQVAEVAAWSDGVIVGSGLVAAYAGSSGAEAAERAGRYVEGLAGAWATAG
ncbi:MAG TPA: tryptophan synthase subunit alpha, partial [Candidatus Dormibacteraeota bacterium]